MCRRIRSHSPMHSGALRADERALVGACPGGVWLPAVGAYRIPVHFQQLGQPLPTISRSSERHPKFAEGGMRRKILHCAVWKKQTGEPQVLVIIEYSSEYERVGDTSAVSA